jgi:hypothetical protein
MAATLCLHSFRLIALTNEPMHLRLVGLGMDLEQGGRTFYFPRAKNSFTAGPKG